MILTITPDPIFETEYYVANLRPKIKAKAEKVVYNIRGQGLNSSRILKNHNVDVFAMGFLGGLRGQYIFNKLRELEIYNDFTLIKDETRGEIVLFQDGDILSIISEESPRITREELGQFYELYNKILLDSNLIYASGSLPIGLPQETYFDLVQMANRKGKRVILDVRDRELVYGIEGRPFMVKLNKEDLEDISKLKLNFENEIIKVGHSIIENGIKIVAIDLNEKGTIVLTKDRGYRLELSNRDMGPLNEDKGYMVSGYAFGIEKQYDLDTTMKLGLGMRIAYGLDEDIDRIDMSDIKRIMSRIEISPIYY